MKYVTLFAFLIMTFAMVSCGGDDKDKSSSNKGFSVNKLSTQNGYLNTQNNSLEIGNQIYPQNPAYAPVINAAFQQSQMRNPPVQKVMHNGVYKYRVKVTAQLMNYNQQPYTSPYPQGGMQGGMQGGYTPGMTQGTLQIQQIVFY